MSTKRKPHLLGKPTFYEILGVARATSSSELKANWRTIARELHPDKNPAPDAADKFAEASLAYATLSDAHERSKYNTLLAMHCREQCGRCKGSGLVYKNSSFMLLDASAGEICPVCKGPGVVA